MVKQKDKKTQINKILAATAQPGSQGQSLTAKEQFLLNTDVLKPSAVLFWLHINMIPILIVFPVKI